MEIFDVSVTVDTALVHWPGDPGIEHDYSSRIEDGAPANVSRWSIGAHTGTHVDAPVHFMPGDFGADRLDLNALVGPARVVDLALARGNLTAAHVASVEPGRGERILFKTANSTQRLLHEATFKEDFTALAADAARALVEAGVGTVGVDYLSVEPFSAPAHETHKTLLSAHIPVIEGLDLSEIQPGEYFLACLPLKLQGSDGAPARAVLMKGFPPGT